MTRWCKLIVVWMVALALPGSAWAAATAPCALMMSAAAGAAMTTTVVSMATADAGVSDWPPCHELQAADAPAGVAHGTAIPGHDAAAGGAHACAACAHCLLGHAVALLPAALSAPGPHAVPAEPAAGPPSPWASVLLAGPERPPRNGR